MKGLAGAATKGGCEETKAVPEASGHRAAASSNSTDIKQRHSQKGADNPAAAAGVTVDFTLPRQEDGLAAHWTLGK